MYAKDLRDKIIFHDVLQEDGSIKIIGSVSLNSSYLLQKEQLVSAKQNGVLDDFVDTIKQEGKDGVVHFAFGDIVKELEALQTLVVKHIMLDKSRIKLDQMFEQLIRKLK
jgi:hypothetical protein